MAVNVQNDGINILEDGTTVNGNVFDNDVPTPDQIDQLMVVPGSLVNANGVAGDNNGVIQGKYGTLTLHKDGSYTYQLTANENSLGAGVDLTDEVFTYAVEGHDNAGNDITANNVTLTIDIHGQNDARSIADVTVSAYEADGTSPVLSVLPGTVFQGQLVAGAEVDTGDTDTFQQYGTTVTVTSSDVNPALLTGVHAIVNPNGTYTVVGDFDALAEGETATVTFQYQSKETNTTSGNVSLSDPKTVTMTVVGTDDGFVKVNETGANAIRTYDQFLDGDIYDTILADDYAATKLTGADVNDTLKVISTGYADMDFYNGGGEINVDNAAKVLEYEPGGSDDNAIEKDHFKFYYQVSDGHNIENEEAVFEMQNKDGEAIDFYTFGDAASEHISGVHDKNNVVSGMGGNDHIHGQEKGDILYGGAGDDKLEGRWGNDIYDGGTGTDVLEDKRGADMYVFSKGDGMDTIEDKDLEIYQDAMGHDDINIRNYSKGVELGGVVANLGQVLGVLPANNTVINNIKNHIIDDQVISALEGVNLVDIDTIKFDNTVNKTDIALFMDADGTLQVKYSDNDMISVLWQNEAHYGVEKIEADGAFLSPKDIENIVNAIATTDVDANTAGIQTAQNIDDVRKSDQLMAYIAAQF